jgi:hypothetical protein
MLAGEWPEGGTVQARLSSLLRDLAHHDKDDLSHARGYDLGGGYCLLSVTKKLKPCQEEGQEQQNGGTGEGEESVLGYAHVEANNAAAGVDAFGGGLVGVVTSVVVAGARAGRSPHATAGAELC